MHASFHCSMKYAVITSKKWFLCNRMWWNILCWFSVFLSTRSLSVDHPLKNIQLLCKLIGHWWSWICNRKIQPLLGGGVKGGCSLAVILKFTVYLPKCIRRGLLKCLCKLLMKKLSLRSNSVLDGNFYTVISWFYLQGPVSFLSKYLICWMCLMFIQNIMAFMSTCILPQFGQSLYFIVLFSTVGWK